MKKNMLTLNAAIVLLTCCESYGVSDIIFKNESKDEICIFKPIEGFEGGKYPDTTLYMQKKNLSRSIRPGDSYQVIFEITHEEWLQSSPKDTVSIFVFSKKVVDTYPWEKIQQDYNILKRYDLSIEDIRLLYDKFGTPIITYPPNEKMKNIKMYPPYQ